MSKKSTEQLWQDLLEQVNLLEIHNINFDDGQEILYKSIATSIRVLLHDTVNSTSLFMQNGLKDRKFFSTINDDSFSGRQITDGSSLVVLNVNKKSNYKPILDSPIYAGRMLSFDDWWNESILLMDGEPTRSRKNIVLNISNKDGGAHNDEKLSEQYQNAKTGEGLKVWANGDVIPDIQKAIIRQISFEVMRTWFYICADPFPTIERSQTCGCGSDKKYKNCCYQARWKQDMENKKLREWHNQSLASQSQHQMPKGRIVKKGKSVPFGISNLQFYPTKENYEKSMENSKRVADDE